MVREKAESGIWVALFFGFCLVIFILQFLRPSQITLSNEGLSCRTLFNTKFIAWENLSDFNIMKISALLFGAGATFIVTKDKSAKERSFGATGLSIAPEDLDELIARYWLTFQQENC